MSLPRPSMPSRFRGSTRQGAWREGVRQRTQWLDSPLATYNIILACTLILVGLGLVMVLSASSVNAYIKTGSAFTTFTNQAIFAVFGLIVMFALSRLPASFFKRFSFLVFGLALVLQMLVLVPGVGRSVNGNTNWIGVGGFTMQPSEAGKLALVGVGALVLTNRRADLTTRPLRALVPMGLFFGLFTGIVMLGGDLGTTMVIAMMAVGMLFTAGLPRVWFIALGIVAGILLPLAVMTSGNRTSRIQAWLGGCDNIDVAGCYQKIHGTYALADGGLWGLGPGASREKWQWLPEAHNDFIFAIIGEELGLPGTLAVLVLYLVLAFACYRLVVRSTSTFERIATAGVITWIAFQAIVNIGSVIGALPIVGVPLPLVSYGGSALVVTLAAIGMVLSFARHEPGAQEMLQDRPRRFNRTAAVLPRRKDRA